MRRAEGGGQCIDTHESLRITWGGISPVFFWAQEAEGARLAPLPQKVLTGPQPPIYFLDSNWFVPHKNPRIHTLDGRRAAVNRVENCETRERERLDLLIGSKRGIYRPISAY